MLRLALAAVAALCVAAPAAATTTITGSEPEGSDIFGCCLVNPYLTDFTLTGTHPFAEIYLASANGFHFGTADANGNFDWTGNIAMHFDEFGQFYAAIRATDGLHPIYSYTISSWTAIGDPNVARVPEPSTWLMLLLGFGLLGAAVRYGKVARGRVPSLINAPS